MHTERSRIEYTYVNGYVIFTGFVAFVITVAVVILLGVWFRKRQEQLDAEEQNEQTEAFRNIEEYQDEF